MEHMLVIDPREAGKGAPSTWSLPCGMSQSARGFPAAPAISEDQRTSHRFFIISSVFVRKMQCGSEVSQARGWGGGAGAPFSVPSKPVLASLKILL